MSPRLLAAGRPADHSSIVKVDEHLGVQLLQLRQRIIGAMGRVEFPGGQRGHVGPFPVRLGQQFP